MSHDFLNRIHQGDCVAGLNALPEGCVDLAFADPPFNIGYKYDVYDDRREHEHYLDWSRQWIAAVHRALKPSGTFWLAIGDEYAAELKLASQEIGFTCRSWVVWYYTFGVNCVNKFTRSHAHLFYFVKDAANFTFRAEAAENRIPSARQLVYNDSRANPHGRLPDDTWILRPQDMADCFTAEEDTWYFPRVAGTFKERAGFHGCQMPEQLLGRIIRCCSHEGDVVLDPFSGSATTLVTAKKLGRGYVGFELSEDYAARGSERLAKAEVGAPLVGAADPTRSAPATPGRAGKRASVSKREDAAVPAAAYAAVQAKDETVDPAAPPMSAAVDAPIENAVSIEPSAVAGISTTDGKPKKAARGGPDSEKLIEAFRRSCDGYSADRVVADPALQSAFQTACRVLGVAGDATSCNAALLKLRKAGGLAEVPTTARTELTWDECEPAAAPAEIAAARVLREHPELSLDDIFCSPERTAEFDKLAARLGGGKRPLVPRWTALKLRKESHQLRERSEAWRRREIKFTTPASVAQKSWAKHIPNTGGIYVVLNAEGTRLYIGAARDLRSTLEKLLAPARLGIFDRSRDIRVAVHMHDAPWTELLALAQFVAAGSRCPLNWPTPASQHAVGKSKDATRRKSHAFLRTAAV
jgi:site-specific DNA-methyltransferase (adenine-specific)